MQGLLWDVFCRVIDNHGDLGVCWRLAADLAGRGQRVRLWVDDARALAWMAPQGCPGVSLQAWPAEGSPEAHAGWPEPGDVVIEAFGCDPPAGFVERMQRPAPPVWINLEYLSAEPYVERSHGLPSPVMSGPGQGLVKRFFYPGFTARTGGLLREPDLLARRAAFDAPAWLAAQGITQRAGERIVSLFCYPHAPVAKLVASLATRPTLLLVTPGAAAQAVEAAQQAMQGARGDGQGARQAWPDTVRLHHLPWLTQPDYDHLLWAADLNIVRGEDSFVRAMWTGQPFLWHIYRQDVGAHAVKLDAFLQLFLQDEPDALRERLATVWRAWNETAQVSGLGDVESLLATPAVAARWRQGLLAQDDLTTQLMATVGRLSHAAQP